DKRRMAYRLSTREIVLADVATLAPIAHLPTLEALNAAPLAFSPDGTQLAAATNQRTVLLWDLRRIREQLHARHLDWDQPAYPPEMAEAKKKPQIPVRVPGKVYDPAVRRQMEATAVALRLARDPFDAEAHLLRGTEFLRQQRWREATGDLTLAAVFQPENTTV